MHNNNTNIDLPTQQHPTSRVTRMAVPRLAISSCCRSSGSVRSVPCLGDYCAKTLGSQVKMGFYYYRQQVSQPIEMLFMLYRIRTRYTREATTAILNASRHRHQAMYCVDCFRASAALLAFGSARNPFCSSPTRCCTDPILHVTAVGSSTFNTSLPRRCLE